MKAFVKVSHGYDFPELVPGGEMHMKTAVISAARLSAHTPSVLFMLTEPF